MLDGINSFLQDSIVLPPGEYDQKKLRPILDMARERVRSQQAKKAARKPSTGDQIVWLIELCNVKSVNMHRVILIALDNMILLHLFYSDMEVMFSSVFVHLLAGLHKNYSTSFRKIWWKGGTWASKETIRLWW